MEYASSSSSWSSSCSSRGRAGRAAGDQVDPSVQLKGNERFRTLRMQMLEPLVAIVVVGSLLLTDLERNPMHAIVAVVGAVAGYAFGAYRARSTYVAAVPQHKGVILRYSVESFVALGLLVGDQARGGAGLAAEGDSSALIATCWPSSW